MSDVSQKNMDALNAVLGDEVSAGMLTDRLDYHEKELWMRKASTR